MKIFSIPIRFARLWPSSNPHLLSISLASKEEGVWDKTLVVMCERWLDGWHGAAGVSSCYAIVGAFS